MRGRIVATVMACLLTASCASSGTPAPDGPDGRDGTADDGAGRVEPIDPVELINLWRVVDAAEDGADDDGATWLRLDHPSYQLWRECGLVEGGWDVSGRALFIASAPFMSTEGCSTSEGWDSAPWLEQARTVERTDTGWSLLAADGRRLARLVVDGAPDPIPSAADFYAQPPEVNDDVRSDLAEPAPLPEALVPATVDDLVGRWIPPGDTTTGSHLQFEEDLTWTGSDGCNGSAGVWTVGAGGRLLSTAGPSTLIGCEGTHVASWLAEAERVGLDGEILVLLDDDGAELGRLARG